MKKSILALMLVAVMLLSVGCSNVANSVANNQPGDFIFNSLENTEEKYNESINDVSKILEDAVRGGSAHLSYNDEHYSIDNILYMNAKDAKYTNLFDGQVYGDDLNLYVQLDKSDMTMWSTGDMFSYDLYEGYFDAYEFEAETVAMMLHDNLNDEDNAGNPTNFSWLVYQLTRLMQINDNFREDFEKDLKALFNEKFIKYSSENAKVNIDGKDVSCVVLKYKLDEYEVADILDTILTSFADYFYYLGATGVKEECFIITETVQEMKDMVEKSFIDLDFSLTVAKDTKAIVFADVNGTVDVAGEKADVKGTLNLGRVASYMTPVTGNLTFTTPENVYEFSLKTDAKTDGSLNQYRLYFDYSVDGTTENFADVYYTFDVNTNAFTLHSNAGGDVIEIDGNLNVEKGKKFDVAVTRFKMDGKEYHPDCVLTVRAKDTAPSKPLYPCVIGDERDPETGELLYTAYDSLKDIFEVEVYNGEYNPVFNTYEDVEGLVNAVIRNSPFIDIADGIADFADELKPEYDEFNK